MAKIVTAQAAAAIIPDGATVMFGGFLGCGSAHGVIDALAKSGVRDLTAICNDAAQPGGPLGEEYYGVAKLVHNRQIKKLIVSHVGSNPEVTVQSIQEGALEVILLPQGSLAEMIRADGAGLGGVLTPTGVGTVVEENPFCMGKQAINGREYLLMAPLHAEFAVIAGYKIDRRGNVWYKGTTSNFNTVMATAADVVIAEAEYLVEAGEIAPEDVRTSGVFVDYIVESGAYEWKRV